MSSSLHTMLLRQVTGSLRRVTVQKGARGKMSVLILAYKRQDKQGLGSLSATGAGSGKAGCLRNGLLMTGHSETDKGVPSEAKVDSIHYFRST